MTHSRLLDNECGTTGTGFDCIAYFDDPRGENPVVGLFAWPNCGVFLFVPHRRNSIRDHFVLLLGRQRSHDQRGGRNVCMGVFPVRDSRSHHPRNPCVGNGSMIE